MAKKLKDVNKDGKINFKDTWLGERLSTKGKLKGPNLAESLKGARRESGDTTSTKSTTKPKPRPAAKTETKAKESVGRTSMAVPTTKKKSGDMGGKTGVGTSASADVKIKKVAAGVGKRPERPVSPTRYKEPEAITRAQTARLGNITEAQWDKMTKEQRRAKGLPESWVDWVKAGGKATVRPEELTPISQMAKRRGYSSQTYSKGGMTKGKK